MFEHHQFLYCAQHKSTSYYRLQQMQCLWKEARLEHRNHMLDNLLKSSFLLLLKIKANMNKDVQWIKMAKNACQIVIKALKGKWVKIRDRKCCVFQIYVAGVKEDFNENICIYILVLSIPELYPQCQNSKKIMSISQKL